MVTAAALSNGLPKTSVKDLIVALSNQDEQALAKIPGLTPQIIGAAVVALKKAYLKSFHAVWYPAIAFAVISLICE
jgi:Holliday junction resolvasome RuvABC DNA-binding subunit